MSKGGVWKNTPEGKTVRRHKITGQWAWLPREALEFARLSGAQSIRASCAGSDTA